MADLAEAAARGCWWDARRHTLDLISLPGGAAWLGGVQLLATDAHHMLLYDAALRLLGALSFADRAALPLPPGVSPPPRTFFGTLSLLLIKCPLRGGLLFIETPLAAGAADYLLHRQHQPAAREALAGAGAPARWRRRLGPGAIEQRRPGIFAAAGRATLAQPTTHRPTNCPLARFCRRRRTPGAPLTRPRPLPALGQAGGRLAGGHPGRRIRRAGEVVSGSAG